MGQVGERRGEGRGGDGGDEGGVYNKSGKGGLTGCGEAPVIYSWTSFYIDSSSGREYCRG